MYIFQIRPRQNRNFIIKVTQINYVSMNQLHTTANFNFGSMSKKAKHCWVLETNSLVQFS